MVTFSTETNRELHTIMGFIANVFYEYRMQSINIAISIAIMSPNIANKEMKQIKNSDNI